MPWYKLVLFFAVGETHFCTIYIKPFKQIYHNMTLPPLFAACNSKFLSLWTKWSEHFNAQYLLNSYLTLCHQFSVSLTFLNFVDKILWCDHWTDKLNSIFSNCVTPIERRSRYVTLPCSKTFGWQQTENSLKREFAVWLKLHRSYSIPFNPSNVGDISGVEFEGILPKFRKRKRKFSSRVHLLHKAGAWN